MSDNNHSLQHDFNGRKIKVIHHHQDYWLNADQIGQALGYGKARRSINNIYNRNKALLDDYSTVIKMMTVGKMREVRIFNEEGVMLITMKSQQPKVVSFQKWAVKILKQHRHGQLPMTSDDNCLQQINDLQAEVLELMRFKINALEHKPKPRKPIRRITFEMVNEVFNLHQQGFNNSQIAEQTGYSKSSVYNILKRHYSTKASAWFSEFVDGLTAGVKTGQEMDTDEIKTNFSAQEIREHAKQHNVDVVTASAQLKSNMEKK